MAYSARTQSVVERVADALRQQQPRIDLPEEVVAAASEKYRLLAIRVRVGSIQLQPASQKDTSERRAVALLEYCTRQYQSKENSIGDKKSQCLPIQLPWSTLAAAVQTKSYQSIQQLQHILVNFLQPTSKADTKKRPNKCAALSNNDEGFESSRSLRRRIHTVSYKDGNITSNSIPATKTTLVLNSASKAKYAPKILQELVIRLAGFLDDPHGIQSQVIQLLSNIYSYYENDTNYDAKGDNIDSTRYSNPAERRGHLYDLQRYAAAYEAAAFYYIASSTYQSNQLNTRDEKEKNSRGLRGRKQDQANKRKDEILNPDNEDIVETDENEDDQVNSKHRKHFSGLQLDDLMDASSEYTYLEIMLVLPRVKTLAEKLKGSKKTLITKTGNGRTKTGTKVLNDPKQRELDGTSMNTENESFSSELPVEGNHVDSDRETSYAAWKHDVLLKAKVHARSAAVLLNVSDEMAIAIAANAILIKHGILPFSHQ